MTQKYRDRLVNSEKLERIINVADPAPFNSATPSEVFGEADITNEEDRVVVSIEYKNENAGREGFDGHDYIFVTGYFENNCLEKVELIHDYNVGPLVGKKVKYTCKGKEVNQYISMIS